VFLRIATGHGSWKAAELKDIPQKKEAKSEQKKNWETRMVGVKKHAIQDFRRTKNEKKNQKEVTFVSRNHRRVGVKTFERKRRYGGHIAEKERARTPREELFEGTSKQKSRG